MTTWLWPSLFIGALVLSAGLHVVAAVISKRNPKTDPKQDGTSGDDPRIYMSAKEKQSLLDERKEANEKYLEIKTAHEPCERTINNLQSQVRRLQERNQTSGIQISARDGQIEQLQAKLDEREGLWSFAKEQGEGIYRFVSVTDCRIGRHELFRHDPYIEFAVTVWNRSVLDIAVTDIVGVMSFQERELTGPLATLLVDLKDYVNKPHDGLVTMSVALKNSRKNVIVAESFHLEIEVNDKLCTVAAEIGEIWEKKYIDEDGEMKQAGKTLRNLADKAPISIREAEVTGDIQFILPNLGADMVNHSVFYRLTIIDTSGEKHPKTGTTGRVT